MSNDSFTPRIFSAQNSFLKDVVNTAAKDLNLSEEKAMATFCQRDMTLASYRLAAVGSHELHRTTGEVKDERLQRFTLAAAAYVHAANLRGQRVDHALVHPRWQL